MKLALRGAVRVLALCVSMLVFAAYALEWARFSGEAIVTLRILAGLAVGAAVAYFLLRPLLRRVTDEQVALYLEEREPSLQALVVSAVEANRSGRAASAALVQRLVEQAFDACVATDAARRAERSTLQRLGAMLAVVACIAAAVVLLGPAFYRHALSALLFVSRSIEAAAPYRIDVAPGHATVPKGADQTVTARPVGFQAGEASLMVRRQPTVPFEAMPLVPTDDRRFEGMLFDVGGPVEYFVEAAGVRSPVFALKVVDLPFVQRLDFEYHFPAYTGLEPQIVENGSDIAVIAGTEVRLRVTPSMSAPSGRVVLNGGASVPLAPGGVLTGSFVADRDGFYRIELEAPTGERVAASPQYTIDVLSDQSPTISFARPGRDTSASPIEEVYVEARAEDDYGVRNMELVYSVNGGAERTVPLFGGTRRMTEVTAGHTFYLEELGVQAGDSVSYFARASDNDTVQGAKRATSDLYFLRVRPFKKDFRQAPSMAGGGGGGGGGMQVDALSEQQRQIIAATFNVQRDRKTYSAEKLREHTVVVALSQARLREQVEGLVTRMNSRLVEPDPSFRTIAELLPKAVEAMKQAEAKLSASSPDAALPPEHRALRLLQKAEEEYETQVSVSRNAGGGSGGGGAMAEELADLFELELDRMANQYETSARAGQQEQDQRLDALLEKLKELARRQEQEAERQRRRAAGGPSSAGGAQQRALAEQAEEAARQLERLAREENRPDLMDSARQMREAADAMRRAASGSDGGSGAQASAALERLRNTERQLDRARAARAERDIQDAQRRAEELAREQQAIAESVRQLSAADGEARRHQAERVTERKDALEAGIGELEQHIDRSAADASRDNREASRRLSEAAGTIRDQRLRDKVRYSKAMVTRGAPPESTQAMENDIGAGLEALRKKLGEAAAALGERQTDRSTEALDRARRLARGVESLGERMRDRAQSAGRQQSARGPEGAAARDGRQGGGQAQNEGRADGRGGLGDTRGGWTEGGGRGDRRPWGFSRDDIRQFRGEVRQWSNEAQALRRLLREGDLDPKELDALLQALRALDDDRVYQDRAELERLQTFVAEGMKRFEYGLRRRVDAAGADVTLSGTEDVPEAFRPLVEQYYRSLAKTPKQ